MNDAGHAAGVLPVTATSLRRPASLAVSLALHALVAALLLGSGAVRLTLQPSPIELLLLEAATQTAGPGDAAPELRIGAEAASSPAREAARVPPAPAEEQAEPVPSPRPKPAAKKVDPARVPVPPATNPPPAVALPSTGMRADGKTGGFAESGAAGDTSRSTAPAWAPAARVRYEELLFAWMNRHKEYPMLAQRRGIEGRGSLRVRIDRDGRVLERALLRSTGQNLLDEAALDMVRRANPFPVVPAGYGGSTFEFVAPIEYRLR